MAEDDAAESMRFEFQNVRHARLPNKACATSEPAGRCGVSPFLISDLGGVDVLIGVRYLVHGANVYPPLVSKGAHASVGRPRRRRHVKLQLTRKDTQVIKQETGGIGVDFKACTKQSQGKANCTTRNIDHICTCAQGTQYTCIHTEQKTNRQYKAQQ